MSRELVNKICTDFPGAENSDPWGGGHDAWKVGGKMFACVGTKGGGVSLKTPDIGTAAMLIEVGTAVKADYFHRSWVFIPFDPPDPELLRHRLEISYDIIRGGLTKKLQATFQPRE